MRKKTLLQAFAAFLVAFFAREAFFCYRVYEQETHRAPSTLDIIIQNGYPAEEHKVKTGDGYILTIFRIPGGKSDKSTTGPKPVVLLQHGTLSCSNAFVSIGPKSLGFLLADRGYDVWLGNNRGNRYALEHSTYNTSDPEFWDFSYDELVFSDIPAIFDYILKFTKNEKLSYVGHSLGATILLGLISELPEYNDKVAVAIALAPGSVGSNFRSSLVILTMQIYAPWILQKGHGTLMPHFNEFIDYAHPYCAPHLFFSFICDTIYSMGGPTTQVDKVNLPLITASISSSSRKLVTHVGRTMKKGKFHRWDSDSDKDYPLYLVSTPVALFSSDSDYLIHPMNVEKLNRTLANVVLYTKVPASSFNHLDFLFGERAEELVYKELFKTLEKCHKATCDVANKTIKEEDPDKNSK